MELKLDQLIPLKAITKSILLNGVVEVVFEKVDGSIRVLQSTLNTAKISSVTGIAPDTEHTKEDKPKRKESNEVVSVFEVNEKAWKSFKLDKLISINTVKVEDIVKLIPKD